MSIMCTADRAMVVQGCELGKKKRQLPHRESNSDLEREKLIY